MSNQNLSVLLQQERLFTEVGSGRLSMEFTVHQGSVKGVRVFGSKKMLYNRSANDSSNNETALKDMVTRISEALSRGNVEQLDFTVSVAKGEIKNITWNSTQDKRFP